MGIVRRTVFLLMLFAIALPVNTYAVEDLPELPEQTISSPETSLEVSEPNVEDVDAARDITLIETQEAQAFRQITVPKQVNEIVDEPQTPALPELIIASVQVITANKQKYIEIANPHATPLSIKKWTITSSSKSSRKVLATLWGTIQPNSSVVIAQDLYTASDQQAIDLRYSEDEPSVSGDEVQIVRADGSIVEKICWGSACSGDGLSAFSSSTQAYERKYDQSNQPIMGTMVERFKKVPIFPVSGGGYQAYINSCSGIRLNEIAANVATDEQFVELYNSTTHPVSLDACHLQTNRSSQTFTFDGAMLLAGAYEVVKIKDTQLSLTKTTSGTVYLLSSDMQSEVDSQSYEDLDEMTSWAYFADGWKQTYKITEGEQNDWQEFLPCEEGYERNPDTGRCRKIQMEPELQPCASNQYRSPETNRCRLINNGASALTHCASNQYRSPETNRCRLIASAGSSLKPCAANQVRNPTTNRCRNIASSTSTLKPCASNQKRNPETNRCRKITSDVLPAADHAIEKISDGQNSPVGWIAFAGVGSLATGYGVWEWRRELGKIITGIRKAVFRI